MDVISSMEEKDVFVKQWELQEHPKFSWEDIENTGKIIVRHKTGHSLQGLLALIYKEDSETDKCVVFEHC